MTIEIGREMPTETTEEPEVQVRRLSFAQEQLWFLDQLAPGETTYIVLMVWRLHGPLRVDVLQRCLNLLVARHESLRITIRNDNGTPYQVVAPATEIPLVVTDLRGLPEAEREPRVQAEIDAQRGRPYDLSTGPLCSFRLLQLGAEEYVFWQGFHHIVTDGWSSAVLNTELSTAYRSILSGTEPVFGDQKLDYTEYAESQRQRLQGEVLAEELQFWQERLADLPVLELPTDRPRPVGGSHRGKTLIKDFPDDLRGIVQQLARDHGASLFMVFAAAFNLVLSRYTDQSDIPIGVPMLGRPEKELEAVVGMFINMVVLRSDLSGDPSFSELIERVTDGTLELYDHHEVAFTDVVDAVQPVRDPDRNPLFQVCLQMLSQNNSGEDLDFPGVTAEYVPQASLSSRFDFTLNVIDSGSSLRGAVEYSADMFDSWRSEAVLSHVETVLRTAASDPDLRLSQIPIVVGEEAEQLLAAGRGDGVDRGQLLQRVGQPHANGQVYVVDRWMNLVPRGVAGELLIGAEPADATDSVDHPEITAENLIDDPFQPGRLVYRSGERVRWTSDLRIEFLGRMDQATLPIEGEVETALTRQPEEGYDQPSTPTEQVVAHIFGEVLSLPAVGAEDSFFERGGNSLQAMRAVGRINDEFGIRLSVRTLYGNATVRAVSAAVDQKVGGEPA